MARDGEVFYNVRTNFARRQFGVNRHIYIFFEDMTHNIIVQMPGH